jgi:hypothetical protein
VRPRILIAGGWGVVGGAVARLIREAGHDVDLVLAGRNPDAGAELAQSLSARTVRLDVADPVEGLSNAGRVDLVVAALQDPDDRLLMAALRAGAGHIGIVRTAGNMSTSAVAACALARRPALMLGHWQAGVLTLATLAAAQAFDRVERVETAALYDYADPIGPMTAGDAADFIGRALIRDGGRWTHVDAAVSGRTVTRAQLPDFDAQPMGVLDTPALAAVTGADHVRFDLGTGTSLGTAAGAGASHDLYIDLAGRDAAGAPLRSRTVLSDPAGQAHLTALGVLIGVERVLGLDGAPSPGPGLALPESTLDPSVATARLRAFGVRIGAEA